MAAGDNKEKAATFAYDTLAFPMLTGSFVTAAGFVPIGFARSSAGEYTFSIFVVVSIALIVSWFVAVLFAPLLGVWLLKAPEKKEQQQKPNRILAVFRKPSSYSDALALDDDRDYAIMLRRFASGAAVGSTAILSGIGSSGACR